jgi:general secretion pathway protein E/type IV pilus assembly protein PilB
MGTLREDGVRKVLAGLTSAEEVISVTVGDVS